MIYLYLHIHKEQQRGLILINLHQTKADLGY